MLCLRHLYRLIFADLKLTTIYEQSARHFDVVRAHTKTDDLFSRQNSIISIGIFDFFFLNQFLERIFVNTYCFKNNILFLILFYTTEY